MEPILEVIRIRQEVKEVTRDKIRDSKNVADIAMKYIGDEDREVLLVIGLNTKLEVIAIHRTSIGAVDSCIVSPREIMKALILNNAKCFMLAHCHPSYHLTPSPEDIEVTERMIKVGDIMGIELIDHLIVNPNSYLSFREKGYM